MGSILMILMEASHLTSWSPLLGHAMIKHSTSQGTFCPDAFDTKCNLPQRHLKILPYKNLCQCTNMIEIDIKVNCDSKHSHKIVWNRTVYTEGTCLFLVA